MPDHPTGTVTFLFTDVQRSTQLWEHHHAWMEHAHRRQEALLREAIAAHGGWAYKQIGDAFQAAFQTARDALAAAVEAQRALAAEWAVASVQGAGDQGSGIRDQGSGENNSKLKNVPAAPLRDQNSKLALKVRMGLHTGTTEERPDDYFGPLLNRAARLMAAGHGGQILLSAATYELIRDTLPAGVTLRDLGERRLKDLTRPEHVWQVDVAGLPTDFPPLKTLDARPNNLPAQPNVFIGRDEQIAAVTGLLRRPDVRLLTLTGPGGTGKTRLALQVAADLLDHFPDGVWFVDLAPLTDPALVAGTIAGALGVAEQGNTPILERLKSYLREKTLLLVLDNYEQVVAAAPDVAALLAAAPRVRALATSRVPLRVAAEHEYAVPAMTLPALRPLPALAQLSQYEAVRLFVERAVAVKADFAATNANAPAIAEICVRLDGLPLAIELAAARVKLFPPEALLGRLADRLKLLTGGARDQAARHHTLRAAIDWSYALLSPGEQQLFRRLAVFHGGCTLEALEAVCGGQGSGIGDPGSGDGSTLIPDPRSLIPLSVDVLEGLQALVDHSLLQQREGWEGEPRFWLLETIHEYAREKLAASDEEMQFRDRHLDYYLALAEEAEPHLSGEEQLEWLDRLADEHDNLRAALGWAREPRVGKGPATVRGLRLAAALWRFWDVRGQWSEGRAQLAAMLAAERSGSDERAGRAEQAPALGGAAWLAYRQGDYTESKVLAEESVALGRAAMDQAKVAGVLITLAYVAAAQKDYSRARALLEESLALRRALGDRGGMAYSLHALGVVAAAQEDYAAARALFEESLALKRALANRGGIAASLAGLGNVACMQGDYVAARHLYNESLALRRVLGDQRGIAVSLAGLGNVAYMQEDYTAARTFYKEGLTLRRALANRAGIAASLARMGAALAGAAAPDDTAALSRAARVLGAATAMLDVAGALLDLEDRRPYEQSVAHLRATLGEAAFAAAWAAGRALSLDEAIAEALAG